MHLSALAKRLKKAVAAEIGLLYVLPLTNSHFHFVSTYNEMWQQSVITAPVIGDCVEK